MSSNKYVPPHLRNKPQVEEERKPRYQNNRRYEKPRWQVLEEEEETRRKEKQDQGMEDTEHNFPALSAAVPKATFVKRSFAQIAAEGHEKSEKEAMKKTIEETHRNERYNTPLPVFHNVRHYVDDYIEPEDDQPKNSKNEDGWVTVDRKKHRVKKTIEQVVQEDEEQHKQQEQENTVWNQPEEHETCWDERY